MAQAIVRSRIFAGFAEFLQARGVALDGLLTAAGLPISTRMPETIPLAATAEVFEAAAHATGEPCIGLAYAADYPIGATGPLGFVITRARGVREAIEAATQFVGGFATDIEMSFDVGSDGIGRLEWRFAERVDAPLLQIMDFMMATGLLRLGQVGQAPVVPLRAELSHRGLPCAALVARTFGTQVRFNAARSVLHFDPTTLARRNPAFDAYLYETVLAGARALQLKIEAPEGDVRIALRRRLERRLGLSPVTLDDVADEMALSARALQWQLEQGGTTYERELSEVRRTLAMRLLTTTDMPLADIAGAVGFGQQSSFTRASLNSWFGLSPSKYRSASPQLRAEALLALHAEKARRSAANEISEEAGDEPSAK